MLYFAYGMNTDPDAMWGCTPVGAGVLHGWKFGFRHFADVQPAEDEQVHGVVWEVDTLQRLDGREGYPVLYDRSFVPVIVDGAVKWCWVYHMTQYGLDNPHYSAPPSGYYLDMLRRGYATFDIPTIQVENALKKEEQHA